MHAIMHASFFGDLVMQKNEISNSCPKNTVMVQADCIHYILKIPNFFYEI